MRLALQHLLANTDALSYSRKTLRAFNGIVELPTPGLCSSCGSRLGPNSARNHISLRLPPGNDDDARTEVQKRPPSCEADNQTNEFQGESHRRSRSTTELGKPIKHFNDDISSHRERLIWHLLDGSEPPKDSLIWLELAHTRRRVHGVEGMRLVWTAILERDWRMPTVGEAADGLWNHLIQLGYEDPHVLKEIFIYARRLKENHGRVWPKLYFTVVGHYFRQKPGRAWLCHMRLQKHFPPSTQHLRHLFLMTLTNKKLRQLFLSMHRYFPQAHIYDIAIPELCRHGMYATAVRWHKKLIQRGDIPSSARRTEPVMQYLAVTGQKARLMEYTRLMVAAGVSFVPYDTQDMLVMRMSNNESDNSDNGYSDDFCARLMATRFFSIETIIGTLGFLRIREIGPLALRAMATRELLHIPYCRAIENRLDQLANAGLSTGNSTFSILVRQCVAEGQSHLLASIVSCDLHTDTFDDHKLQESLLTFYYVNSDKTAFDRTMAILLAKVPTGLIPAKLWNLTLRSRLVRQELEAVKDTIGKMQDLQIQIEPKSVVCMSQRILSPRQVGRGPAETKELGLLIRIWQDVLRSGGLVPPWVWNEIFRRLGMSGRLIMFERLALWLASWYSSPIYRTSLSCLLTRRKGDAEPLQPSMVIDLKTSNPLHPLHVIFNPKLQQAIVAWGFQHTFPSHKRSVGHGRRPDWTWGLALLRKLRDSSVYISQPTVRKAFKLRVIGLFGPGNSKRKINQRVRWRNKDGLGAYVGKAKRVWGNELFHKDPRRLDQAETSMIRNSITEVE